MPDYKTLSQRIDSPKATSRHNSSGLKRHASAFVIHSDEFCSGIKE